MDGYPPGAVSWIELVTTDGKAHRIENKGDVLTIDGIAVVVPDVKWNKGIVHVLKRDIA